MDSLDRSSSENGSLVENILKAWKSLIMVFEHALVIRDYLEGMNSYLAVCQ